MTLAKLPSQLDGDVEPLAVTAPLYSVGGKVGILPKYRFKWELLPPVLLRRLAAEFHVNPRKPASGLTRAFGARPDEEFVRQAWPVLRDQWLASDGITRRSVVIGLQARGLGNTKSVPRTARDQLAYLHSCRNGPALREVVLKHLIPAGEPAGGPAKPAPSTSPIEKGVSPTPGGDRADDTAWAQFRAALANCLSALSDGHRLIVSVKKDPNYYVQFAANGDDGLRSEAVSNSYLDESQWLDGDAQARALAIGWHPPTDGSDEDESDGEPNYFCDWAVPVPFEEAADAAVDTLVTVFEVPHPGALSYRAFTDAGNEILLPTLGISPERTIELETDDEPIESPDDVRAALEAAMKDLLETDEIEYDDDGDIPVRFGSAMVFVRVPDDVPVVTVLAPMLWDIPHSTEVLEAVNDLNQRMRFARAVWTGTGITLSADVPAIPFVPEIVMEAIKVVGTLADEFDEELQERLGGRVFFGPALPPKDTRALGGYL